MLFCIFGAKLDSYYRIVICILKYLIIIKFNPPRILEFLFAHNTLDSNKHLLSFRE